MNAVEIKAKLHEEIESSDERLLKMIYALVKEYKSEGAVEHVSLEQYNAETDAAMKRMDAGEFTPHEQVVILSK